MQSAPFANAPFTRKQAVLCFAVAALLDTVMGLRDLRFVLGGEFINPDSYMRIMRLEESLRGHMLAQVIPRDSSGMGTLLAWSHLLDAVLLALAAPFMPFMDLRGALHAGGVLLGPLATGLLGVALAWATAPLAAPPLRWLAAVMAGLSVAITGYGAPGVVHHHIPVALAVVVTLGWAARGIGRGAPAGWRMGLAAGLGIVLTPESMPFILMGYGALGVAWLSRPEAAAPGRALRAAALTQGGVILAAWLIDPPMAGYGAAEIDRLSTVWIGFALACAAIGLGVTALDRGLPRRGGTTLAGLALALGALAAWIAVFPDVAKGPGGLMPPAMARAFFSGIQEMMPIRSVADGVAFLSPGVLGLGTIAVLAWRGERLLFLYAALCGAVMVGLALLHVRFSTYPAMMGAAFLPVALTLAGERRNLRAGLLAAFMLLPPLPPVAGALLAPATAADTACPVASAAPLLAPYAGAVVMADPNETPELLYHTRVDTVGSLYHRGAAAFIRLRDAWRATPGTTEPEAVRATRARFVLVCPHRKRSSLVADLPPGTLRDALDQGHPPPWLARVGGTPSGYVLYRVAR